MATSVLLALIFSFLISHSLAFTTGINSVVYSLSEYQSSGGGFQVYKDSEATLESTSQALFLSSLFGLRDKIDANAAASFLQSLANPDYGYGNKAGQGSDVESVRNALLCHTHLGLPISNSEGIFTYILSLYDRDSKLFAPTVGGAGDLKSTGIALLSLELINKLQNADVVSKFDGIKQHLESIKKERDGIAYFSLITADNHYAILVGSYVGFDFGDGTEWAQYFYQRQVRDGPLEGGFYSDSELKDATIEDSAFAVGAVYNLQKATENKDLLEEINTKSLLEFVAHLPRNLASASYAYIAVSRTSALQSLFKIVPVYDVLDSRYKLVGNRIIQGTQTKLSLSVKTPYGLPHAGLDVSATVSHSSGEKSTQKLTWNSESNSYGSQELFDSNDKLGDVSFEYVLRWRVADIGVDDLVLNLRENKTIGYDLSVNSKAVHAGKEVEPGSEIGVGTEFSFEIQLGTTKQPKPTLTQGDFNVIFEVYDSSAALVHRDAFSAKENTAPISFKYTLTKANIPAGDLAFSFGVANEKGLHTSSTVFYRLPVRMVASHISFAGFSGKDVPKYKIGERVSVEFSPACLPDLRTLHYFDAKNPLGTPVRRRFYMQVSSAETGVPLFHLQGLGSDGADGRTVYKFELPIAATFSSIGVNAISFFYESVNGEKFPLLNYDSSAGELFEESAQLTYTVQAELHVNDITSGPKDGNLVYGDELDFEFTVIDKISGKTVWPSGQSTVSLVLSHVTSDGSKVKSNVQPAQIKRDQSNHPDVFHVQWSVNPNAVSGDATLELVVIGNDIKEIPLLDENSDKTYSVSVKIGGKIDVSEQTFSDQIDDTDTVFLAEVSLTCNSKELDGAQLRAVLNKKGKDGKFVQLSSSQVSSPGEGGTYEVSFVLPNSLSQSGDYYFNFYREVDIKHALEQQPKLSNEELQAKVQPLFSVVHSHTQHTPSILPFKTEFLVLSILIISFLWTSFKKMDIEGLRKSKKEKSQ